MQPEPVDLPSEVELQAPHSAAAMRDWVSRLCQRIAATDDLEQAARRGENHANQIHHELLPISYFVDRYFDRSPDVEITYVIGNQQHDAVVRDGRPRPGRVTHIEVTVSDWDYNEALRNEILNRDGHVTAFVPVQVEGLRGRRARLEAPVEAVDHDELRRQHLRSVGNAIDRKLANQYPHGTALVVRVDDFGPFRDEDDVVALDQMIRERFLPRMRDREFVVLALEGGRGVHLVFEL